MRDRATGTWDRLETMFYERVAGALRRLGIPRREDLERLEQRVAELEKQLAEQDGSGVRPVGGALPGSDEEE